MCEQIFYQQPINLSALTIIIITIVDQTSLLNVVQNYFECYMDDRVLAQIVESLKKKPIIFYKEYFLVLRKIKIKFKVRI